MCLNLYVCMDSFISKLRIRILRKMKFFKRQWALFEFNLFNPYFVLKKIIRKKSFTKQQNFILIQKLWKIILWKACNAHGKKFWLFDFQKKYWNVFLYDQQAKLWNLYWSV